IPLDHPRDTQHFGEVAACLIQRELRGLGDVVPAPDDDGVTCLPDVGALQVRVAKPSGKHADPEPIVLGSSLGAHGTIFPAPPLVPVRRPLPHEDPTVSRSVVPAKRSYVPASTRRRSPGSRSAITSTTLTHHSHAA